MKKKNIVLIGMSGCGKTTVGKLLAEKLGYLFTDTDDMVEQSEGISINKIFERFGEEYFRAREHEACVEAGKQSNSVIATGGGVILNQPNIDALQKDGIIIYIERSIEDILKADADIRPLFTSQQRIRELHQNRQALYRQYADIIIVNDKAPDQIAQNIINILNDKCDCSV